MEKPLDGVTVVELATSVAGPYATLILGGLGARVIKVERPDGGDEARGWRPPSIDDMGVMFAVMNAGKESVSADLADSGDRKGVLDLIEQADVVVTSLRQASLRKLGLDGVSLIERNPFLIHCRISAFGTEGPLAAEPGYDPLVQAFVGLMAVTGEEGRPPVRVGTSIVDMGTGMWTAIAILSALAQRRRTGRGCCIDTSLVETGIAWLPYQIAGYLTEGREPRRLGSALAMLVPYQAFETADGYIIVAAGNDRIWHRLCLALGRRDLASDPSLVTNPQRVERREYVVAELGRTFIDRGAIEWEELLRQAQVPCSVVRTVGEAVAHEQVRAVGILSPLGKVDVPSLPFRIDGRRPQFRGPAPALGEQVGHDAAPMDNQGEASR